MYSISFRKHCDGKRETISVFLIIKCKFSLLALLLYHYASWRFRSICKEDLDESFERPVDLY